MKIFFNHRTIQIGAFLLLNSILLVGCGGTDKKAEESTNVSETNVATTVAAVSEVTVPDVSTDETGEFFIEMMDIETPYIVLKYPSQWLDFLETEENNENGVYSKSFYCKIGDRKIEMFSIYFGEIDFGTEIGYITVNGNVVKFSVDSTAFIPDDTWTDGEKKVFDAMSYGINHIIDSVVESKNFLN